MDWTRCCGVGIWDDAVRAQASVSREHARGKPIGSHAMAVDEVAAPGTEPGLLDLGLHHVSVVVLAISTALVPIAVEPTSLLSVVPHMYGRFWGS